MFEVNAVYEGSTITEDGEKLGDFTVVTIDETKQVIVLEHEGELIAVRSSHKVKFLETKDWIIYS